MWVGARTHGAATKTQSGGQRSEDALGRRQPTEVCNRFGARDFLGRKSRRKRSAAERRAPSLPFFYNPSLFREPACGRAETAFSRSEDAVLDEDSKKGTNRCCFCQFLACTRQLPFSTARK